MTNMKMPAEATAVKPEFDLADHICTLVSIQAEASNLTAYETAKLTLKLQSTLAQVGMDTTPQAAPVPAEFDATHFPAKNKAKRGGLLPNPISYMSTPEREARIRSSITDEAITCLECGQPHKMLKRHLGETHGISVAEYKARWGLDADYPIVSPAYSRRKAEHAKNVGFGTHART